MPYITDDHLRVSPERKNISDCPTRGQKGFVLRTTPNGVFTYFFQHLNKTKINPKTKKPMRDWHKIGEHPEWSIDRARAEAGRLSGLVAGGKSIKVERQRKVEAARAGGITFEQLHDEYIADCQTLVKRRWGMVPRKESWLNIKYSLGRSLAKWHKRIANEISGQDIMELYRAYEAEGSPAAANCVLGDLRTLFNWGMHPDRAYITVNPCPTLKEDDQAVENADIEDGRTLDANELRRFWFGLDHPDCPGERLSRLVLKLSLVTLLRTGECVAIPRSGVTPECVTIPLWAVKSRRAKKSKAVEQPLNSLAREILGEVFIIGDSMRDWAFPNGRKPRKNREPYMAQQTLSCLMTRRTDDDKGQKGINEFLGLGTDVDRVTPHDLRRTGASILSQLGFTDAVIGKVMTHKTMDKEAAPVTRQRYIIAKPIIARPVDPRIEALDALDAALREILGLPAAPLKELPVPQKLLKAA